VTVALEHVDVQLDGLPILHDVSLEVATGEPVAILGPSGSGKSTLLRTVAGLQRPSSGRVLVDGMDLAAVPAHERGIGLVFQDGALFPHRDVGRNVAYGLEVAGRSRKEAAARVADVLQLVGLPGFEHRDVATLSGGEGQRVGLARALAPAPRILLLDEPLGALDGPLRDRLKDELKAIVTRLELTVMHVTHDVGEAFAIGARIVVVRDGAIAQIDTPERLWEHPADDWVASFLGMRNIIQDGYTAKIIRPEAIRLARGAGARVLDVERQGPSANVRVLLDDGTELEALVTSLDLPARGAEVEVTVAPAGVVEVPVWKGGAGRKGPGTA
jgi:thiamine transport system ATP-binding protein